MPENNTTRCGFVAVIGAPNAGKSTLINGLVGSKVSIVSHKVQTTRTTVRGIAIEDNTQIIFIDTPGIFSPKPGLEKAIVTAAWEGQKDADITALIVDAARPRIDDNTANIIKKLATMQGGKRVLILNKIDKAPRESLLALTQKLNDLLTFDATFMISALKEDGIQDFMKWTAAHLPEGPWHYPEDQISDMPMRLLAAEITREKLFLRLHKELPYNLTVETENWEEFDNGSVKIDQLIYVTRDGHKKIILGKGGSQIKAVGQASRLELEEILDCRVHLKLLVKVRENWQRDPERFSIWGLDSQG